MLKNKIVAEIFKRRIKLLIFWLEGDELQTIFSPLQSAILILKATSQAFFSAFLEVHQLLNSSCREKIRIGGISSAITAIPGRIINTISRGTHLGAQSAVTGGRRARGIRRCGLSEDTHCDIDWMDLILHLMYLHFPSLIKLIND